MRRITVITSLILLVGCKPDVHDHGEEHAKVCSHSLTSDRYDVDQVVEQPGAEVGDLTRCPISGSVFQVTEMSPKTEQKGKTYYTCCGGCVDQLNESFARRK